MKIIRSVQWIDAFWLKLLMAVLMVADHLYYRLFPRELYAWHLAARIVAPMFAFFVAEGMAHTRSRAAYIKRLFFLAVLMLAGNILLFAVYGRMIENSVLMELGIGALMICCIDRLPQRPLMWTLALMGLAAASLFFEGMFIVPLCVVIFYLFRNNRPMGCIVFAAASVLVATQFPEQIWMAFAVVPIAFYNGRRGASNAFSKYFFYVFYPLHIWIIFFAEQYAMRT